MKRLNFVFLIFFIAIFTGSCANFRTGDKATKYGTIVGTVIGASIVGRVAHINTNDRMLPAGFIGGAMVGWAMGKMVGKTILKDQQKVSSEYDKKIEIISSTLKTIDPAKVGVR